VPSTNDHTSFNLPKTQHEDVARLGKKAICIEDLRRRVLTLELKPGEYLDEVELANAYGISRPPVREVLRQLAGEGYVTLHENRGAQVTPMTHKSLRNFFISAPMIYAAIARLAAEHVTPHGLARLKQTQVSFRKAIKGGNTAERALMNERFHAVMGEVADNEYLMPSLRSLLIDHTRIGMTFYSPRQSSFTKQQAIAADHHDQFIAHIESRESEKAAEIAIAHWELSRTQIENFVTPESIYIPLGSPPRSKQ
jgi:DNA-binding GntR family transcriptional regulator